MNELDSICGVSDDELTERFKEAIRIDNEIKKIKGYPLQDTTRKRNLLIWNILMEGENMQQKNNKIMRSNCLLFLCC